MANIINGTDTGSGGLITTGDSSDELQLQTAETARVTLTNTAVVVNEGGNDVDFRVEGDTNANLLFVDASADAVGIGTSSPYSASSQTSLSISGSAVSRVDFYNGATHVSNIDVYSGGGTGLVFRNITNLPMVFATNNTERMSITTDATPYLRLASGTGGIQFGGDTAAANALDDYEEGTWTPTFTAVANCSSLSLVNAWYVKIGGLVTYSMTGSITVTSSNTVTKFSFTQPFSQSTINNSQGGSAVIEGPNPFPYAAGTVFDASGGNSNGFVSIGATAINFNGASAFYLTGCFQAS